MDTEIRGEGVEVGEFACADLLAAGDAFLVALLPQEPLWAMQIKRVKTPGNIAFVNVMLHES